MVVTKVVQKEGVGFVQGSPVKAEYLMKEASNLSLGVVVLHKEVADHRGALEVIPVDIEEDTTLGEEGIDLKEVDINLEEEDTVLEEEDCLKEEGIVLMEEGIDFEEEDTVLVGEVKLAVIDNYN